MSAFGESGHSEPKLRISSRERLLNATQLPYDLLAEQSIASVPALGSPFYIGEMMTSGRFDGNRLFD